MGGEVEVVVRRARAEDGARRADLLHHAYSAPLWDAFLYFFFQELTLECCVLGGAVLFIFCGVPAAGAAGVLPAAAALVLLAVLLAHHALATHQAQKMTRELVGLVAEARGPLWTTPPPRLRVRLAVAASDIDMAATPHYLHTQVVGTASVAVMHGEPASGWLHGLAVHPQWRRRGVGSWLERGARAAARGAGLRALHAAASHLQPAAAALLHTRGWECRGAYARPLCGAALVLPVARFALTLDPAYDLA